MTNFAYWSKTEPTNTVTVTMEGTYHNEEMRGSIFGTCIWRLLHAFTWMFCYLINPPDGQTFRLQAIVRHFGSPKPASLLLDCENEVVWMLSPHQDSNCYLSTIRYVGLCLGTSTLPGDANLLRLVGAGHVMKLVMAGWRQRELCFPARIEKGLAQTLCIQSSNIVGQELRLRDCSEGKDKDTAGQADSRNLDVGSTVREGNSGAHRYQVIAKVKGLWEIMEPPEKAHYFIGTGRKEKQIRPKLFREWLDWPAARGWLSSTVQLPNGRQV
ncbi:uncharacterized protein CLUP02_15519 [Colletotrichum lupini]|uniref:Uncharacterized protein n=1 Tax=Colletotrichum lupini TaxID=145971 RepID=A0A9Q8T6U8_9PEZI|nr:uncharacterized protein CLUP02_15519 [Colletotrichum lupini]UQC89988.1 hypothetical protein CLUP02_15519 [Colletotrichum lupini]